MSLDLYIVYVSIDYCLIYKGRMCPLIDQELNIITDHVIGLLIEQRDRLEP